MSNEIITNFSLSHFKCINICIELRLRSHYALAGEKIKIESLDDDGYAKSESGKSTRSVSKNQFHFQRKEASTKTVSDKSFF